MSLMTIKIELSLVFPTLNNSRILKPLKQMQRRYMAESKQPPRASEGSQEHISLLPQRLGFLCSLTCSSSIVDPCKWRSTSEMWLLTNSFSWTRSFSDSASSLRITPNSSFSFLSSFASSLSRICLSFVNSPWTLCISVCIWVLGNEKKTERGTWTSSLGLGARTITILLGKFPQGVKVSQSWLDWLFATPWTV